MSLIIAIILIAIIGIRVLGDKAGSVRYQSAVNDKEKWKESITNEQLERDLLFAITDTPGKYSDELHEAYAQIEEMYAQLIKPVYGHYVARAALMGEDKREYWDKEMLIDSDSVKFNCRLQTRTNKLRILLANRGYLRSEDARDASLMSLGYKNPVEGVVLKWCTDKLYRQGKTRVFGKKDRSDFTRFQLYYSWPDNGYNFFSDTVIQPEPYLKPPRGTMLRTMRRKVHIKDKFCDGAEQLLADALEDEFTNFALEEAIKERYAGMKVTPGSDLYKALLDVFPGISDGGKDFYEYLSEYYVDIFLAQDGFISKRAWYSGYKGGYRYLIYFSSASQEYEVVKWIQHEVNQKHNIKLKLKPGMCGNPYVWSGSPADTKKYFL